MRWLELASRVDNEVVEAVSEVFRRVAYGGGVVIEPDLESITDDETVYATTSTVRAYEALEEIDLSGKTVLDVGTGSGILTIAAAKHGARTVVGVDVDPIAVEAVNANIALNAVTAMSFSILHGSVDAAPAGTFDLVVAN